MQIFLNNSSFLMPIIKESNPLFLSAKIKYALLRPKSYKPKLFPSSNSASPVSLLNPERFL